MTRRPPRSTRTYTLFPYTTLFLSLIDLLLGALPMDQDLPRPTQPEHDLVQGLDFLIRERRVGGVEERLPGVGRPIERLLEICLESPSARVVSCHLSRCLQDRKSTRLNSSH